MTADELRELLNRPEVLATVGDRPARLNRALTKAQAHEIFLNAIASTEDDQEVRELTARNILREFGGMSRKQAIDFLWERNRR